MPLANDSYQDLPAVTDRAGLLDLSWTVDEGAFLDTDLQALVAEELTAELTEGMPFVNSYLVRDPFGADVLRPALSALFPGLEPGYGLVAGAGVLGLLPSVARLAEDRPVYVIGDVYPDLPHWAAVQGAGCVTRHDAGGDDDHARNAVRLGAGLVLLERPDLTGPTMDPGRLRDLCAEVHRAGITVLVDESYANYYPAGFSCAPLVNEVDNLVVARGLAKAYGMGGLRLGYCLSSAAVLPRLAAAVPPMLASSLSLRIGRAILSRGDLAGRLRARVRQARDEMLGALREAGLAEPTPSCPHVPFVYYPSGADPAPAALTARGVLGKRHTFWSERTGRAAHRYRLSTPLRPERMAEFRRRLGVPDSG